MLKDIIPTIINPSIVKIGNIAQSVFFSALGIIIENVIIKVTKAEKCKIKPIIIKKSDINYSIYIFRITLCFLLYFFDEIQMITAIIIKTKASP